MESENVSLASRLDQADQAALDEARLSRFVRDRDLAAFDALASRYLPMMRAACRREIADRDLAEDATSVALLLFAEKASTIRSGSVLPAWLLKTACLTAKNVRRQEETRMKHLSKLAKTTAEPAIENAGPHLNHALLALSDRQRSAVLLRFSENQSLASIGRQLGISEDAARMIVNRSLSALRRNLRRSGATLREGALAIVLRQELRTEADPVDLINIATPRALSALGAIVAATRYATLKIALGVAVLSCLAVPAFGRLRTAVQASAAIRLLEAAQQRASHYQTLRAVCGVDYTTGSMHGGYKQNLLAERPSRFRIEIGPPYLSNVITNGTEIYTVAHVGTADESFTKSPYSLQKFSGSPQIDAFLGKDMQAYATKFLGSNSPSESNLPVEVRVVDPVKRKGRWFNVVEFRRSRPERLVRYFVAPDGLLEGVETKTPILVNTVDASGNRKADYETQTASSFLENVQLGRPIGSELFAFDEAKSKARKQPDLITTGSVAPDFIAANAITGQTVNLRELASQRKAILIDFWFVGCPPCRAEMPDLNKLLDKYGSKGLEVLCLNGTDTSDQVKSYFQKEGLKLTPLMSPVDPNTHGDANAWKYGVRAYPTTLLVGPDLGVIWFSAGAGLDGLPQALAKLGIDPS